ncbi:MAG: trigger factor [Planctomycetales bacterium]|nr:trigger factor [Planctomycetales bacterium]
MSSMETEMEDNGTEATTKTPLQIDVKVDSPSACERHVVVSIPQSELERYRREAYDDVAPKAELPGFRAGKAPRRLVESRFKDQVAEQVKSSLVMDSLQQITDGEYFSAISEPDFDYNAIILPEEGDFRYEFKIEVRPDFETPNWNGLELRKPVATLTDQDIDAHLARTLTRFMDGDAVDGEIVAGDRVTLNARFEVDGKQINSFEEEVVAVRQNLSFGDAIIEGFDALVVGKKEGDTFTATFKLSDSAAREDMREMECTAHFDIVEAKRIQIDDIGTKMLDELGFDDVEELRNFVREELERQFEYHQQQALRKQIVDELTKNANWDMPEALIRRQTSRELQRMVLELQRNGFTGDQIKAYVNASRNNARESTIRSLREHFILEKIAEELKIEPTAEQYDHEIQLIAEQNDSSPRKIRARLEKSGQMDAIRNQIIERQVIDQIAQSGKVSEEEDKSFLSQSTTTSDIDFAIAGEYSEIPEAKHDNDPAAVPGAPKLPEKE